MPSLTDVGRAALPGLTMGALAGGVLGGGAGLFSQADTFGERLKNTGRGAVHGGLSGGAMGGVLGAAGGSYGPSVAARASTAVHPEAVPWLKGVSTRAEAKQRFREAMRKAHPDLGGSHEAATALNTQWGGVQEHPSFQKWAFFRGAEDAYTQFGLRS